MGTPIIEVRLVDAVRRVVSRTSGVLPVTGTLPLGTMTIHSNNVRGWRAPGRTDAERNCVSNVRPEGLTYAEAARRVDWLAAAALARGLTGVELKDESDAALPTRGGAEQP